MAHRQGPLHAYPTYGHDQNSSQAPTNDQRFGLTPVNDMQMAPFMGQRSPDLQESSKVLPWSNAPSSASSPLSPAERLQKLEQLKREAAAHRAAHPNQSTTRSGSNIIKRVQGKEGAIIKEHNQGSSMTAAGSIRTDRSASEIYVEHKDGDINAGGHIQEAYRSDKRLEYTRSNYHKNSLGNIHTIERADHIVIRKFQSDDTAEGDIVEIQEGFSTYTRIEGGSQKTEYGPKGPRTTRSSSSSSAYQGNGFSDFRDQPRSNSPAPMEEDEDEEPGVYPQNGGAAPTEGPSRSDSQRSGGIKSRFKNAFRTRKTGDLRCD